MTCEEWKGKLPNVGGGQPGDKGTGDFDDAHLLLGTSETRGSLCMSPQLHTWPGAELATETLAAKERRKAREGRALATENTK